MTPPVYVVKTIQAALVACDRAEKAGHKRITLIWPRGTFPGKARAAKREAMCV